MHVKDFLPNQTLTVQAIAAATIKHFGLTLRHIPGKKTRFALPQIGNCLFMKHFRHTDRFLSELVQAV